MVIVICGGGFLFLFWKILQPEQIAPCPMCKGYGRLSQEKPISKNRYYNGTIRYTCTCGHTWTNN
ncbi:MAG: hypothetical protein GW815_02635 [Candidatus Moranbacteria bacterium]|nr:hypothetical protein [Candidatus Moranbacteria bacterium]